MGVASQVAGSNLQFTIDHRATPLNNGHTLVRIRGKNMRHGAMVTGYIVHVNASPTLTQYVGAHCPTCAETITSCLTQALLDSLFRLCYTYLQPAVHVVFLLISVCRSPITVESDVILVLMSAMCVRPHLHH